MSDNNPAYYIVIPASVRFDKSLPANAKLLYGDITALTSKEGYCWATNSYFAELYEVNEKTISLWISKLKKGGHIITEVENDYKRKIFITPHNNAAPPPQKAETPTTKTRYPPPQKADNINTMSTTTINKNNIKKPVKNKHLDFILLTTAEYDSLIKKYNKSTTDEYIERINNYVGSTGKRYKSHYYAILQWMKKDDVKKLPPVKVCPDCKTEVDASGWCNKCEVYVIGIKSI